MPTLAAVSITGDGHIDRSYAIINGYKYISTPPSQIKVKSGDVITFGVYGSNYGSSTLVVGEVTIDGLCVLMASSRTAKTETYDWVVPRGISSIQVDIQYLMVPFYGTSNKYHGVITVTTA